MVLKTSDKQNCFVETKNLDGETNLKVKKSPKGLAYLKQYNDQLLYKEKFLLEYERPNPYLY